MTESTKLISVVVPTKNSAGTLEICLKSIKEQNYGAVELIVVDNASSDNTCEVAEMYADKVLQKGPERSAQRNFGVASSNGDYVVIIDSDMELTPNVLKECVARFDHQNEEKALVIPEESVGFGFWAQCKRLERSFYVGVSWMEAARCFRKSTFDEFAGYDENNTGTEDYDLPQRMIQTYGADVVGSIEAPIVHHEGDIKLLYSCKKKFYYARRLDVYKEKGANHKNFTYQSNPLQRYKLFFSKPKELFRNPLVGIGMLFMKTMEFASGALGYVLRRRSSSVESQIYKG